MQISNGCVLAIFLYYSFPVKFRFRFCRYFRRKCWHKISSRHEADWIIEESFVKFAFRVGTTYLNLPSYNSLVILKNLHTVVYCYSRCLFSKKALLLEKKKKTRQRNGWVAQHWEYIFACFWQVHCRICTYYPAIVTSYFVLPNNIL